MGLDALVPIAPARVRALVLPVGQIKQDRFLSFVDRLRQELVCPLRDISADGRPNRSQSRRAVTTSSVRRRLTPRALQTSSRP